MHHRLSPKEHRFEYRLFMLGVDLGELERLDRRLMFFSIDRGNLFSLRQADYLPRGQQPHNGGGEAAEGLRGATLGERVREVLAEGGIAVPEAAQVELVTLPRIMGYQFNPVSFYFCRDAQGRPLAAIAEVTNTFREVKLYRMGAGAWDRGAFRLRTPKYFYVSPFSDVDVEFDFVLRPPGERLALGIDDFAAGRRTLATTLTGRPCSLSDGALARCAVKYPLLTLQVMGRIHWHALLLWWKRVPWFAKAARAGDQRDILRPHRSLTGAR